MSYKNYQMIFDIDRTKNPAEMAVKLYANDTVKRGDALPWDSDTIEAADAVARRLGFGQVHNESPGQGDAGKRRYRDDQNSEWGDL